MYRRKGYSELLAWKKKSRGKKALMIEGARRVGKSTLVEEFARNEYESHIIVDFSLATDEFKQTFLDTRFDINTFYFYLQAEYNTTLHERRSLVVFDEVQLFPKAREFVKHLVADGRCDIIETGSLISIKENVKDILLPSEEDAMKLHPMDFEEFLWAMNEDELASLIKHCCESKTQLPNDLHRRATRLMREYVLVGGMPQVVQVYEESRNFEETHAEKETILRLYRNDIEKYGKGNAKRIKRVFDQIPRQLAKHEKKFVYSQVEENSRSRDFSSAFTWLKDAATVNICTLCTDPSLGLSLSEDDSTLKCYMADTGLLAADSFSSSKDAIEETYRQVLLGKSRANEGMLIENFVAQQLVAKGHELHFYSKWSPVAAERMEIDFLLVEPDTNAALKPRIAPVEVKSANRYGTRSLHKFQAKFKERTGQGIILHPRQLMFDDDAVRLPLYMVFCL